MLGVTMKLLKDYVEKYVQLQLLEEQLETKREELRTLGRTIADEFDRGQYYWKGRILVVTDGDVYIREVTVVED